MKLTESQLEKISKNRKLTTCLLRIGYIGSYFKALKLNNGKGVIRILTKLLMNLLKDPFRENLEEYRCREYSYYLDPAFFWIIALNRIDLLSNNNGRLTAEPQFSMFPVNVKYCLLKLCDVNSTNNKDFNTIDDELYNEFGSDYITSLSYFKDYINYKYTNNINNEIERRINMIEHRIERILS